MDFSEIASRYERDSLVQASAAELLRDLLGPQPGEEILDLGCGTGHLTEHLHKSSGARLLGVDASERMIAEARQKHAGEGIAFQVGRVEELEFDRRFDGIFCNSAFQWFKEPGPILRRCYQALKPGGRMVVQAPARRDYCPNFLDGLERVRQDPLTNSIFAGFREPWLFRDTSAEYQELFEETGFLVPLARIQRIETPYPPAEVWRIFKSGAAVGYLDPAAYPLGSVTPAYLERFSTLMQQAFADQAGSEGQVALVFYRLYLAAVRP